MVSKISLLPEHYKKRNKLKKQLYFIVTITTGVAIFLALIVTFVTGYRMALKKDLDAIIQQQATTQSQIAKLKKYEDLAKQTQSIEGLLNNITSNTVEWNEFFLTVSDTIPSGVYLKEMSTIKKDSNTSIKIKGSAMDNNKVAAWIDSLNSIPGVSNVSCSFASRQPIDGETYSNFDISADIKATKIAKPTFSKEVSN